MTTLIGLTTIVIGVATANSGIIFVGIGFMIGMIYTTILKKRRNERWG